MENLSKKASKFLSEEVKKITKTPFLNEIEDDGDGFYYRPMYCYTHIGFENFICNIEITELFLDRAWDEIEEIANENEKDKQKRINELAKKDYEESLKSLLEEQPFIKTIDLIKESKYIMEIIITTDQKIAGVETKHIYKRRNGSKLEIDKYLKEKSTLYKYAKAYSEYKRSSFANELIGKALDIKKKYKKD